MTLHHPRASIEIGADTHARRDAREAADSTFRVLILGDFGGTGAQRQPLAERVVHRIDRDGLDSAIAAIAPTLAVTLDEEATPEAIVFRELDDFHPDRLLVSVPALARLRELRATIESRPDAVRTEPPTGSSSAAADNRSLLDRILEAEPGETPTTPPPPTATAGDDLSAFVRRAVRPHVAREVDPQQRALVAQVDGVLAATLRVLLHDPAFQALESLWRSTEAFLRRCDAGESTVIGLLDLTRVELAAFSTETPESVAIATGVAAGAEGGHWSLVIAAYDFGPSDIALLAAMASRADAMRTPWLAAANSRLVGALTFADNGDADDWDQSSPPGWDDLRAVPAARYLGLALPRFLVRLPYGPENPVDSMSFDELSPGTPRHESFLWGNGAFLCALVAATPVERGAAVPSHGTIAGLPLHLDSSTGATEALPCAETLLSQRAAMHVLGRGLTPLVGERNGDAIRIPRLQSIAHPPIALPIHPAGTR